MARPERRPTPLDDEAADKLFVTKYGQAWAKTGNADKAKSENPISAEFRKLCQACGLYKKGRSFYSLRHVFQTIGEEAGETATRYLMGHADDSMSGVYRERISADRLRAVVQHVHDWLWPEAAEDKRAKLNARGVRKASAKLRVVS
jgi:integrase